MNADNIHEADRDPSISGLKAKRVVIAGMGFGGLSAAKTLAGSGLEIVMVDRQNYHLFQPLLYQVATAGLEQESIAYPVRALARQWKGTSFRMGEVNGIDFTGKRLLMADGELPYDYLVLAAGSRTNFFGIPGIEQHAFDLKKLSQAEELRNHILLLFERASREPDQVQRRALLTFVIVGGGPTGVEFAGALRELSQHVLSRDYPEISSKETRIILVEAAASLLTAMPTDLREYAAVKLRDMGVEILLNTRVTAADASQVTFHDGSGIHSHTLFWSAGVAAADLADVLGVAQGPAGRITVLPDLSVPDHPEVFVIGDMACLIQGDGPLPMMAPVASQQGRYVARAIVGREQGEVLPPFSYIDKGAMATIGRSSAVAVTHGFKFSGYLAWLVWLVLHLYYLIGFRNRLLVLMNWSFYYFFHERQVRLITGDDGHRR
jgi:NADH dehydrogenase